MSTARIAFIPSVLFFAGLMEAQSIEMQLELMNPIGTETSRKGDLVSARVLSPPALRGDMVEGRITESRAGAKLGGKSIFSFHFDTLRHDGAAIGISSQFKSAMNSKGRANVDEEGRIVKRASGNVGKTVAGTGVGAVAGGLMGRGKGAAIGAAVGAGATIAMIEFTADAPHIRFAPGSRIVIDAASRDGSSLTALGPARPPVQSASARPMNAPAPTQQQPQPAASAPLASAAPAPSDGGPQQPEFTTLKAAFVPGEKTLFYDDFTDMSAEDAPPHFKVRGAAPELRGSGNLRQLTVLQRSTLLSPNLTALPKNFTYEAEVKWDTPTRVILHLILLSKRSQAFIWTVSAQARGIDTVAQVKMPYQELGRKVGIPANYNDTIKLALWVQDGRIRAFVNGDKHLDVNQVSLPPIDSIEFGHDFYGANQAVGYRNVRFAESAPDFSQTINASGRYVTHGILFDTGQDRLKPESAAVIQAIAKGLETNPNLRLKIEGHTDSVGNAAQNMDLSKRRAEAVKAVLVAQFHVDESRLTAVGMGQTKPIDSNDTPQGRSQNRRVELVKQ